jgi:WD40 repeat protein
MLKGRGKPMARLLVSDSSVNGDTAVEGGDRLARLIGSVEMTSGDSAKTMAPETGEPTAFISYSRKDIAFVDRLEPALKARGVDARVDREDIEKGEEWWKRIQQLIAEADTVIFVLSPDSAISPTCQQEIDFAEGLKKRLIPIIARDLTGEPAPAALARLNYVFFTANPAAGASGDFDQAVDELVHTLETNIEWIREHTRLGVLARRWDAHGRPGEMELRGEELSQAETWLTTRPKNAPDPTDTHRAYITESRRAETKRQRRTVAMLVSVVVAALALSGLAVWQWREAARQRDQAIGNLRQSQIEQSRFLADQAGTTVEAGDAGTAILLALEGLPGPGDERPDVPETDLQLEGDRRALRERFDLGHDGWVANAAFSPDGQRVVTASLDKTARLWDAATGQPIGEPLRGHEDGVQGVAFSPDGKRIVTASDDKTARIWDAATGQPIGEPLNGHTGPVSSAAFSPDGKRIVTASDDKTARIWDAATGQPIGEPLRGHEGQVNSAAFSPDGKRIVTASHDTTARIWDAATGQPIGAPIRGHVRAVLSAAFSPDGKRIVTASDDRTARIWDAATGQPIGSPLSGHEDGLVSAAFSPDGQRIVTASKDGTARLWDALTGQLTGKALRGHDDFVFSAAFSRREACRYRVSRQDGEGLGR